MFTSYQQLNEVGIIIILFFTDEETEVKKKKKNNVAHEKKSSNIRFSNQEQLTLHTLHNEGGENFETVIRI